ncbi:HD domain-containing protein [Maribacter algicola]|uniref:HD domain-containing protein n=1 Tax=Maribacter algicola TaxID=2498892 RepID=A0A426RNU5_9FLAO|nr:Pycsar system effector family protein [Maribacter algicola]RRQ50645.1 HD domain-containing protein [Maribacter algicola]
MDSIIAKTEAFVTDKLGSGIDGKYLYHNLRHTERVVKSAKELMEGEELHGKDREKLMVAAWFHDVGYLKSNEDHESHSCQMARDFLTSESCDEAFIDEVCVLILATKMNYEPKNHLEEIMRDADSSHFAKKSFIQTSELLREELKRLGLRNSSVEDWRDENIHLLRVKHRFYTDFAKEYWQSEKDKNIRRLVKAKKKSKKLIKKESLKAKFKGQIPDRGVQTLYRVTLRNHIKLSDIADTKANILLSVNAIIISLALANLIPKLDNPRNDYLIYPTFIFIFFSIISMIMSILATKPNVTSGEFTDEDVRTKKVNLLFFGNFHKMKLEKYQWAIKEVIKDQDYIYSSLTKDLYYLGIVLERKYRLLRWTYTVFMVGMILSVIVFAIALKYYGPDRVLDLPVMTQ